MAIAVNDSNFEEVVLKAEVPVLVDFWAEWCGPCKMMLPIVEEISKEFEGKLVVAKVNVDEGSAAAKYGIRNIPTILFFKNGEQTVQTHVLVSAGRRSSISSPPTPQFSQRSGAALPSWCSACIVQNQ